MVGWPAGVAEAYARLGLGGAGERGEGLAARARAAARREARAGAHPDKGGSPGAFQEVQAALEVVLEDVRDYGGRGLEALQARGGGRPADPSVEELPPSAAAAARAAMGRPLDGETAQRLKRGQVSPRQPQPEATKNRDSSASYLKHTSWGHGGAIHRLAFSPDGNVLASASADGTTCLWCPALGDEAVALLCGHADQVTELCWSKDASFLVSGSLDHTARVWKVSEIFKDKKVKYHFGWDSEDDLTDSGSDLSYCHEPVEDYLDQEKPEAVVTVEKHVKLLGHTGRVTALVFSLTGTQVFTGSTDSEVRQWCSATGKCVRILGDHTRIITDIALHPDGKTLASASGDETVRLWDTTTGECRQVLDWSGQGPINICRFSPAGFSLSEEPVLVTCHVDLEREVAIVCVWDMDQNGPGWVDRRLVSPFHTFSGLPGKVTSLDFALLDADADGDGGIPSVAVSSSGGAVRLFDLETKMSVLELDAPHRGCVNQCLFAQPRHPAEGKSPNPAARLYTCGWDGFVRCWDTESGEEDLAFHTDGRLSLAPVPGPGVRCMATPPDGTYLAAVGPGDDEFLERRPIEIIFIYDNLNNGY